MVGICIFAPLAYTDTELTSLAECEGVPSRFGKGERERINKISNSLGKALSLGGLCALGRALNAAGVCEPSMPISRDEFGKPRFERGEPHFSIAHAGALSVAAVSDSGELGVDLERIDRARDTERIASKFFSESEKRQLFGAEDRATEFYRIWTSKEAMMKLSGGGMVSVMSADSARAEESGELSFARYAVSFEGEEYILTLCTEKAEPAEILVSEGAWVATL